MTGPEMLIRSLATLIGVEQEELRAAWDKSKDALPQLAREFQQMNDRHARIEDKLDHAIARLTALEEKTDPKDATGIGDMIPATAERIFSTPDRRPGDPGYFEPGRNFSAENRHV